MSSAADAIGFLREFVRHPLDTGAVLPTSRAACDLLASEAGVPTASHIAELGPGTGVCTERILRRKRPEASLLVLELNPAFVERTKARCPDADVRHDSAAHLPRYLDRTGGRGFDAIVSCLPWASFGDALQDELLEAIVASLAPGGRFVTIAYTAGRYLPTGIRFRKKLSACFADAGATSMVWANVPPAFVYVASKTQEALIA